MSEAAIASDTPAAAGQAAAPVDLRRFHHGDPREAGGRLPAGIVPAALHPFRSVAATGDWPLLLAPDREPFARPLARALADFATNTDDRVLSDLAVRLDRAAAALVADGDLPLAPTLSAATGEMATAIELHADERERLLAAVATFAATAGVSARLVGFGAASPWRLADRAARRAGARARTALVDKYRELVRAANALLDADAARRSDGSAAALAGRLGALGSQFLDPSRLADVVAHRRTGEPFAAARREELEQARNLLASFAVEVPAPIWIEPREMGPLPADLPSQLADDPCAAACAEFDRAAAQAAELVRAARRVALESAGEFDPERHPPGLERLDWRSFEPDELALVPRVFAVVGVRELLASGLQSMTRLLLSGRPIQVVVPTGDGFQHAAPSLARFEPGYLGLGFRETFVHQGSIAHGEALASGFARAAVAPRAALHVVDLPDSGPAELAPWWVANARVAGRAAPLFRYEPDAGAGWARRLAFDDNPEPAVDWPHGAIAAAGSPSTGAPFTYADAALLDPAWRGQFAAAPDGAPDLLPLAAWLDAEAAVASRALPFVEGTTADGTPVRLVVSRVLAWATRDRRELWRTLEELAGVRSEHLDEAVAAARREAEERAAREREELVQRHAGELERVRVEAAAAAVGRIVSGLMGSGGTLAAELAAGAGAFAPVSAPSAPGAAGPSASSAVPTPAPAAAPPSDAWIDSALCTSCDECTRKYPAIFVYNADKQATVKNPRGGSFRDLVRAAEACPARVIHPGEPWNPGEKDLASWVARAKKFD